MKGTLPQATSKIGVELANDHNYIAPAHDMYESAAACASPSIYTSSIQAVWMTLISRDACGCATAAVTTLQIHAQSNLACRPPQKHPWPRCSCCSLQQCQSVFCSRHVATVQDGSSAQSAGACSYFGQQNYRPLWQGFPFSLGIPALAL